MDKGKILVCLVNYDKYCTPGVEALENYGFTLKMNPCGRRLSPEELHKEISDVVAVVADNEDWDEAAFAAAPKLKVVAKFGTGMDNFDLEAARRHGVVVANCAGVNANTVAEHTVALLLSAAKHIPYQSYELRKGNWVRRIIHELSGAAVGILGFGAIGGLVAQKLAGFDVRLIAYDKYPNREKARRIGVEMLPFEEVIASSDYLTVHLPYLPDTHHILNDASLAKMKDGVFIVNTARGMVADETAVYRALESGKLGGYASDVFEHEPPTKGNPLFRFDHYTCTPHIAGDAYENMQNQGRATAGIIIDVMEGREPKNRMA
jgi:D-3-phosphoglycerate dehydrogenase